MSKFTLVGAFSGPAVYEYVKKGTLSPPDYH
jgi:hypothetical protein